jgi:hypothetical protein
LTRRRKYYLSHKVVEDVIYRKCSRCDEWFVENLDNFYMMNKSHPERGYTAMCRKCSTKDRMDYRYQDAEHYEKVRQQRLKSIKKDDRSKIHNEQTKAWMKQNSEQYKNYGKQYWKDNPDKAREYNENRQHKNHVISKPEWNSCKDYFNNSCAYCGLSASQHYRKYKGEVVLNDLHKEHVDHEGLRYIENCVPSCVHCNSSKWKHPIEEWYRQQDFFSEERLHKIYKWINGDFEQYKKK